MMKYILTSLIFGLLSLTLISNESLGNFNTEAICSEIQIEMPQPTCALTFCPNDREWVCEDYGNGGDCDPMSCSSSNCNP